MAKSRWIKVEKTRENFQLFYWISKLCCSRRICWVESDKPANIHMRNFPSKQNNFSENFPSHSHFHMHWWANQISIHNFHFSSFAEKLWSFFFFMANLENFSAFIHHYVEAKPQSFFLGLKRKFEKIGKKKIFSTFSIEKKSGIFWKILWRIFFATLAIWKWVKIELKLEGESSFSHHWLEIIKVKVFRNVLTCLAEIINSNFIFSEKAYESWVGIIHCKMCGGGAEKNVREILLRFRIEGEQPTNHHHRQHRRESFFLSPFSS